MSLNVIPIFAYLDPGTGSFVIQMIIGAVVAAGAFIKLYWKKIKMHFMEKGNSKEV